MRLILILLIAAAGCTLNLQFKDACMTTAECVNDYTCVNSKCVLTSSVQPDAASAADLASVTTVDFAATNGDLASIADAAVSNDAAQIDLCPDSPGGNVSSATSTCGGPAVIISFGACFSQCLTSESALVSAATRPYLVIEMTTNVNSDLIVYSLVASCAGSTTPYNFDAYWVDTTGTYPATSGFLQAATLAPGEVDVAFDLTFPGAPGTASHRSGQFASVACQ
jgi:hypothetical protein